VINDERTAIPDATCAKKDSSEIRVLLLIRTLLWAHAFATHAYIIYIHTYIQYIHTYIYIYIYIYIYNEQDI